MDNVVNCLGSPNAEMARVISSQAPYEEGSTTIPKGSRAKWSEAQSTLWGEDIVWSLQKCRAALKQCGGKLTTCHEHQTNELKRDQEFNLVGVNNTGVAGNNTTIRETASLSAWIGTNVSHGTNGASPGGGTATTEGTTRAMTETRKITISLATMKDTREKCLDTKTRKGEGNPQTSHKRKDIAEE